MSAPIYAIPDIHGQAEEIDRALDLVARDGGETAEIVFLGDYVDRGPASHAVLDRLAQGKAEGLPWHILLGNHDRMMRRFLEDGTLHDENVKSGLPWLDGRLGGAETLASYGVTGAGKHPLAEVRAEALDRVPEAHRALLRAARPCLERGPLLFVHAGIRPGVPLSEQSEDDLIWIRTPFHEITDPHPWLVVHGHTALDLPRHFGNRIDLDGGAGHGRPLWPAVFEGTDCWLLTQDGRQALTPAG